MRLSTPILLISFTRNKGDVDSFSSLFSAEEAHFTVQNMCEELKQKLQATEADKQSGYLKMTAEIDDLNRTKTNLEERLIELIKYDLLSSMNWFLH